MGETIKPYAVVSAEHKAINFINWDGVSDFDYGAAQGNYLVPIVEDMRYGFDWAWNGSAFVEPPDQTPVPISITRRQCALQLLALQYITDDEALAMTKLAEVPAVIAAVFDAAVANGTMTADQRILAEIDFAATNYYRSNSLLSMMGLTDEQIDQFFISASTR